MNLVSYLSNLMIPAVFLMILLFGCYKKVDIYDTFIEGAKDGLTTVVQILPTLIGLMVAVGILRASGFLDILVSLLKPVVEIFGFPAEVIPLSLMRLVSSSAANGMVADIFQNYGPDSFIGRVSSVIMGCTESVFYTLSVYFMAVGIKKTKYTLKGALIANITGILVSYLLVLKFF